VTHSCANRQRIVNILFVALTQGQDCTIVACNGESSICPTADGSTLLPAQQLAKRARWWEQHRIGRWAVLRSGGPEPECGEGCADRGCNAMRALERCPGLAAPTGYSLGLVNRGWRQANERHSDEKGLSFHMIATAWRRYSHGVEIYLRRDKSHGKG
jgi:hypothetical protein